MLRALRDDPAIVIGLCARMEYTEECLEKCRRGLDRHHRLADPLVAACKILVHHVTRSGSGQGPVVTWSRHAVSWYTLRAQITAVNIFEKQRNLLWDKDLK